MKIPRRLAFIFTLFVTAIAHCAENIHPSETINDKTMKTFDHRGSVVAYKEAGEGELTLFFVHGSLISKEYWDAQVKHFSSRYHVIAIDLPAHGHSQPGKQPFTTENCGEAVVALIKALKLKKMILIGHSVGADVILEAAAKHPQPVYGFVVIDYFKNVGMTVPQEIQDQTLAGLTSNYSKTMETWVRTGLVTPATDPSLVDRVIGDYLRMDPVIGKEAIVDLFGYPKREVELLSKLKPKVYLINVDYKPTDEASLKKIVREKYELIPMAGTSHYPMVENPAEFNKTLQRVIQKIEAAHGE